MPRRLIIWPYKMGSQSARNLAEAMATKRVRPNGKYRHRLNDVVINWGNSEVPHWPLRPTSVLNPPQYVRVASNKLLTAQVLSPMPEWTTDREVAAGWLSSPGLWLGKINAVVCRTLTRANSGRGIVFAKTVEELVPAPLYTRYTPKSQEYRVHVFKEFGAVDVQQKRQVSGGAENKYIRNHPHGWVFCRENLDTPQAALDVAEAAILSLNLDFGAVDIGYHPEIGTYIYEVNTAPGLEGQTLTTYAQSFSRFR